jgi:hypothetical protein
VLCGGAGCIVVGGMPTSAAVRIGLPSPWKKGNQDVAADLMTDGRCACERVFGLGSAVTGEGRCDVLRVNWLVSDTPYLC